MTAQVAVTQKLQDGAHPHSHPPVAGQLPRLEPDAVAAAERTAAILLIVGQLTVSKACGLFTGHTAAEVGASGAGAAECAL